MSLWADCGLDRGQPVCQIAGLDQLAGTGGGADECPVASDRVFQGKRLDGRGLKEPLGALHRA